MTSEWLIPILVLTVAVQILAAPLAVVFKRELDRAKEKTEGLKGLGYLVTACNTAILVFWFAHARQTGQWLYLAIPATSAAGSAVFRRLAARPISDRGGNP